MVFKLMKFVSAISNSLAGWNEKVGVVFHILRVFVGTLECAAFALIWRSNEKLWIFLQPPFDVYAIYLYCQ